MEEKGQTPGTRRTRDEANRPRVDSFDSVRPELAGFGEYGSFVVRRGARGDWRPLFRGAEPSGMIPTMLPGRRRPADGSERDGSIRARRRANRESGTRAEQPQELRTNLLFVTRVCVNPSAVSPPHVCTSVYKRAATKATMYYHR